MQINLSRIICRLDIKGEHLIKGINFEGLRKIGNPNEYAKKYSKYNIDEFFLYDAVASLYDRNQLFETIKEISKNIFIPICLSGGIRTLLDIERALKSGADKIAFNSILFKNFSILSESCKNFGVSNIVVNIETKKNNSNFWEVYINGGRDRTGYELVDWIKRLKDYHFGEIIISSIDYDGTLKGFDYELLEYITKNIKIDFPLIFGGGCKDVEDIKKFRKKYKHISCFVGSAFHYNKISSNDLLKV
jgi:cyclase